MTAAKPKSRGWSPAQRKIFVMACSKAKLTGEQRYTIMRWVGMRDAKGESRPSVKHPRNTNAQHVAAMAIVESQAAANGMGRINPPREASSWNALAQDQARELRSKARRIAEESALRFPGRFTSARDLLGFAAKRVCKDDAAEWCPRPPRSIEECDAGQVHRVVELLRAMCGRIFLQAGVSPTSFTPSAEAYRRVGDPRPSVTSITTPTEQGRSTCHEPQRRSA